MDQKTILRIIVPTLNRPEAVMANLRAVINSCATKPANIEIQLRVSENNSDPHLKISENEWNKIKELSRSKDITFLYRVLKERLSLGQHMHDLLGEIGADWQLWIGDDDCLSPHYINTIFSLIEKNCHERNIAFAGIEAVNASEFFKLSNGYSVLKQEEIKSLNYELPEQVGDTLRLAMRGNQLSGLLIRDSLIKECLGRMNPENLYPWITLTSSNTFKKGFIEISTEEIAVTSDTVKLFSYGKDGLQGEIAEAILAIPNIDENTKRRLTVKILSSPIAHWRMRCTGDTFFSIALNIFRLVNHPKIPVTVALKSLPSYYRTLIKDRCRPYKNRLKLKFAKRNNQ